MSEHDVQPAPRNGPGKLEFIAIIMFFAALWQLGTWYIQS